MSKEKTNVVSIKRIEANRRNAKLSTGPKTSAGKFRSSRNSLKHGLEARRHLIIGEDVKEFQEYKLSQIKFFDPKDPIEMDDCIQIITLGWKLRRFSVVETGLFNQDIVQQIKTSSNNIGVNLMKRSDFEDVAKELNQIPELQGLSFRRDCKEENANIKLNTMYIRTLVCRQKLIDNYFARRNLNKNKKPILLKIAPDVEFSALDDIIALTNEIKIDGLIATNTTLDRSLLNSLNQEKAKKMGPGGLSGQPLLKKSNEIVQYLRRGLNQDIPIIASGGIFNGNDAQEKINAGASLIQVWTGFIYEGPSIVKNICQHLSTSL